MKRLFVFAICFALFIFSIPAIAQSPTQQAPVCDLPNLQNYLDVFIGELGKLKIGGETDPVKISNTLQELANQANMMRAVCDGLVFSGSGTKLLGPIAFPAGVFRATMTTPSSGYVGAQLTVISGTCGVGNALTTLLFNSAGGDAKNGIESLFASSECTALIQLDIDASKWDIKFERITTGG